MPTSARTLLMSVLGSSTSTPSMKTWPESDISSRLRQRSRVLLPEPEGPITTTTSPAEIDTDTSTSAFTSCGTQKVLYRLRTSIIRPIYADATAGVKRPAAAFGNANAGAGSSISTPADAGGTRC